MAKPKYKSRATRASDQASEWRSLAEDLRALAEDNNPEDVEEELKDSFIKDVVKEAQQKVQENFTIGEVEELRDEMASWRDNYPENLQSTDKYSMIDDAVNTLDNLSSDEPGEIVIYEDIEAVADELERMADDLEGVEFPGMFG